MQRKGLAPVTLPYALGFEGVGRIRAAGKGAGFAVGQRVASMNVPGSYASPVAFPAAQAIAVPDSCSMPASPRSTTMSVAPNSFARSCRVL